MCLLLYYNSTPYHIRGTFGGDFKFGQSSNLMYANTTYNHVYYEQCILNTTLFTKLKYPLMCVMSQFAKLPCIQYIVYPYRSNECDWFLTLT